MNCVGDDGRADQDIFDSLLLMMLMSVVVREEKVIVVDDVVADIGGVEVLGGYCGDGGDCCGVFVFAIDIRLVVSYPSYISSFCN